MADGTILPGGAGYTVRRVDADQAVRDAELDRLAALDPISYDRERAAAAERLGCRVSTLDDQVLALRPKPVEAPAGRGVELPEVDPWPETVTGGELLDALAAAVRRHVILSPAAADAIALWTAHTWIYERFQHTPRLAVTSPAKRCGKSTLLDVLHATSRRSLKADNVSASGVFRTVEALRPLTLLLDEADSFLGDNEELRGVCNSGYEITGAVIRVQEINGEHLPLRFGTYAPMALAGIGKLPATLEDRAVLVALQRKAPGEEAVKLRAPGARAALAELARKLARWAADRGETLHLDPDIPAAFGDREGDICVPLLAIADDAGGEWPKRARDALLNLFHKHAAEEGGAENGVLLLADLRAMFFATPARPGDPVPDPKEYLGSAEIVDRLGEMESRPWPEWRQGKPMTAPQLAKLLRPFGIIPRTVREGGATFKGYYRKAFTDAWDRYLPPDSALSPIEGGLKPSHRHNDDISTGYGGDHSGTSSVLVPEGNQANSLKEKACDGVTAPHPPVEGKRGIEPSHDGGAAPDQPADRKFNGYVQRSASAMAAERAARWNKMGTQR